MDNNFQFISAAVSDRGLSEKRPQNEDSYLELGKSGLFAVADGVGGAQAGDVASQMAVEILSEAFVNMRPNGDAEEVMQLGIEKANSAIFQMSHDLPQLSTMATTVVALHLQGNIATVGHVGDSRLYRLDANGNLYRETQDHSIVEEEVRAGRMTAAQAAHHPSRNVISRALGAEPSVEIDLKTIMFDTSATFLLCSDGITRHIEDYEIRDLLNSEEEPQEICRQMKKICYQRGAEDNLTAVIVKVSAAAAPVAAPVPFNHQADELDEPTVATARPARPFEDTIPPNFNPDDADRTVDLKLPANYASEAPPAFHQTRENSLTDPANTISIAPEPEEAAPVEPQHSIVETRPEIITDQPASEIERDEKTYRVEESRASGFFSKVFSSLLLLIVGAILGVGIYYFTFAQKVEQQAVQAPPLTQMQTPDIEYSSLENNRRNVDKDPALWISSNAVSPQGAEDYFLLGRAYLLTGKYAEAKKALTEANNRLAQAKSANSKTIANEIAIEMAIINDPLAQRSFEKDLATINGGNTAPSNSTNSSAGNTNSANMSNSNSNK